MSDPGPSDTPPHAPHGRPGWLRADLGLGRDNGLLFWGHVTSGFAYALYVTIWTLFIERLGASAAQIGLVIGGAAVVRTVLVLPAGALADRMSPKIIMLAMMPLPILGALVLVVATEWWHALFAAVLMDVSGISIPAISSYIAAAAPEDARTRAYTYIFNIAGTAGMIVGPAIGGWVASAVSFRAVFAISAGFLTLSVVFVALIHDRRPVHQTLAQADAAPPALSPGYGHLLRLPGIWVVLGFHTLVPLLVFTGTTLLPNFMEAERGLSVRTIGTLGSLGAAVAFGFALFASHWKPLTRPFLGMGVSLSLVTAAFVIFLTASPVALVALAYMLRQCFSPIWAQMAAAVAEVTPERMRGRAYGLMELGVGVGDTGGPLMAGRLYGLDPHLPMVVALASTAPMALAAFVSHRIRSRLVLPARRPDDTQSSIVAAGG